MSGILSSISGKFSQILILGTVAPVAAFVILFLIFGVPLIPFGFPLLSTLDALDVQGKVILISLGIMVLSLLLYNLNIPIIRFYEGYPWENWSIGRWRKNVYCTRLQALKARAEGMRPILRAMDAVKASNNALLIHDAADLWRADADTKRFLACLPGDITDDTGWQAVHDAIIGRRSAIQLQINGEFPSEGLVLPTRLGNVIRSFEYYPAREYGMDAVTLWPRLVDVLGPAYAGSIDDAKTAFDFMLNSSVLSMAMMLLVIGLGLANPIPISSAQRMVPWLATAFGFFIAANVFYELSIGRASAWGEMVKGAFDLYKDDLRKKLGYTPAPGIRDEEKALWKGISKEILYGGMPPTKAPDYVPKPARELPANGTPNDIVLEVTRGVRMPPARTALQIFLSAFNPDRYALKVVLAVRNPDAARDVEQVTLKEQVPDGLDYVWDSVEAQGRVVSVSGCNPYTFGIGRVGRGQTVIVTYRASPRMQDKGGS